MTVPDAFIPLAAPTLGGREREYVLECLDTNWISSAGDYVARFEQAFADFCGTRYGNACCNGTAALHAALLAVGIGPGDEVIVPTLTFVASANAVTYCGATPVFVDCDPDTWNLDVAEVEARITPRTKGIVPVHLYGQPADMDPLMDLAEAHGLKVVEDSAQAHGALYKGRPTGSIGHAGTFSLYGNKVLTTGEGGVVVTDDAETNRLTTLYKGQGMDPERRYWFPVIGHNYRMTNIAAAIGLAQVERAAEHKAMRSRVFGWYRERLSGVEGLGWQTTLDESVPSYWITTVTIPPNSPRTRDEVMATLMDGGIETRPVFYPMHVLPPYRGADSDRGFPVADDIARRGISLPTWEGLTEDDIDRVCERLTTALR